jgi:hypothetical protein
VRRLLHVVHETLPGGYSHDWRTETTNNRMLQCHVYSRYKPVSVLYIKEVPARKRSSSSQGLPSPQVDEAPPQAISHLHFVEDLLRIFASTWLWKSQAHSRPHKWQSLWWSSLSPNTRPGRTSSSSKQYVLSISFCLTSSLLTTTL